MSKVLIIGAGGVGSVVVKKCALLPEVFSQIMLASRTLSKVEAIAKETQALTGRSIETAQVDADNVEELIALIKKFEPKLVINVALPYQDLPIMDACLATKTHYLDTANYEPKDVAKFEYSWQWAYQERFKEAGIMALLGCGFDPGVTGVFTAYAAKHHFDQIEYLDIVDCNAGSHGKAFATNFNPEINIREITQRGKYWLEGKWQETEPLEINRMINYPEVGPKKSFLLYHEELESLAKNFPTLKRARFWMTFSDEYITHLRVLENVGMTRIDEVEYQGVKIVPLQFLKAVLPEPSSLGENYQGQTSIGCHIRGVKDGKHKYYYVYNNCDHAETFKEVGAQAISYTTGVPAMIGAKMMLEGKWFKAGVYNVEEFNPDPFMDDLNKYGLPWHQKVNEFVEFND
ncbi:saccharopine dehydrogenase family protein [Hugenholtzia roseola]|uniref:saccharopine dehydrogenase family protein n=1 Tax=Hugenholtzia roseola TaxID=1002 RepID=UPI0003F93A05|nr:saccharopine dehydrogenase family protein [Hugenholtzia roseola]